MKPRHRFVILRQSRPVWTCETLLGVTAYLWGRDIKEQYVVYDYERPVPVDDPDLLRWEERHWPLSQAAGKGKR